MTALTEDEEMVLRDAAKRLGIRFIRASEVLMRNRDHEGLLVESVIACDNGWEAELTLREPEGGT